MANTNGDVRTPLLPTSGRDSEVVLDIDGERHPAGAQENPFEFLVAPPLALPRLRSVDPFRNHTPSIDGAYEWFKVVLCVPLALARLLLLGLALAVGFVSTKLALEGWKDKQSPMPRWRSRVMWVTRICARFILFAFGYHWIKRIGRPAPREVAPIVVANHISYIEPIFFFYELFPTIVASESHDALPFVGTIIRAMQVIFVDRFSAPSRKHAVSEIKGTTTNGRFLISFQLGAFIHGFPVQPVVVHFPHVHFDQSWGNISLMKLMFRMFTQFHNFMEVEYLPIIAPLESKQENAVQFAERTSYAMASALNVVQTSHSYGDLMLMTKALELAKDKCSATNYMVEMALVESSYNISTSEAMEQLDRFFTMQPDSNGCVEILGFLSAFGLGPCPLCEKIFGYFDLEKKGAITFRQFLIGSAQIRKQPLFWRACETAFTKCSDMETNQISERRLGDIIQSLWPYTSENLEHLFHILDIDNDGIVSRDDFMGCLRKNPLLIALFAACMW